MPCSQFIWLGTRTFKYPVFSSTSINPFDFVKKVPVGLKKIVDLYAWFKTKRQNQFKVCILVWYYLQLNVFIPMYENILITTLFPV